MGVCHAYECLGIMEHAHRRGLLGRGFAWILSDAVTIAQVNTQLQSMLARADDQLQRGAFQSFEGWLDDLSMDLPAAPSEALMQKLRHQWAVSKALRKEGVSAIVPWKVRTFDEQLRIENMLDMRRL